MKIRITDHIPVREEIRPKEGEVYEVTDYDDGLILGRRVYFVKVNGKRVGVLPRECVIVPEVEA